MNILKQLGGRLTSDTPKFWKKVRVLGVTLTAISVGLLAAPENVDLPQFLIDLAGYLATGGFVLTVVAQATTTSQELTEA